MQQLGYLGTLQRDQHYQSPSNGPQGHETTNYRKVVLYMGLNGHIFNCPEEYIGESDRSFGDLTPETPAGPHSLYISTVTPQDTQ